jgi:8-oxo-dGTP diphosphatase
MEPAWKPDFQTATGLMAPANEGVAGAHPFLLLRGGKMTSVEDSLIELRCAVAVVRGDAVLLVQRPDHGGWVLSGGRPHPHEGMASCARRETREDTGLDVYPNKCALVLEVNDPLTGRHIAEWVFIAEEFDTIRPIAGELGRRPVWVGCDELKTVTLHRPIVGFLLEQRRGGYARYLSNMWRPEQHVAPGAPVTE